ncbi:MAG: cztS [Bacteroidetes bacterium]|jgi:heavy metal sensor kinase|nr:cztS [Bacteroidota bacterium]
MNILHSLKSVRSVLTFWYALILVAAFTLFGYGVFVYLRQLQEVELEKNLTEEVDWIAKLMDLERSTVPGGISIDRLSADVERRIVDHFMVNPRNYIIILTTGSGGIVFQSPSSGIQILPGAEILSDQTMLWSMPSAEGGSIRVAARRIEPFVIHVAYTEKVTDAVLEHLLSIFLVLAPIALIVSVAGGWFLSGIVFRPIRQVSQLARKITAENLDQQVPPRNVNDELGELITTINEMIRRLRASFDQMREFSVNVAHELKTPLTILKGESELALAKPITRAAGEKLATTYLEETVRMSRIVEDLLMLAKADAGQLVLQHEAVPMADLVRDLFEDAQILCATKKLHVVLRTNDQANVRGDALRLRQLFRAILSNAVQYTDPGGEIRISSTVSGHELVVEIEDTGVGIPAESIDKIFQRFFRAEGARDHAPGGSGLGLAIAKWIAEVHHGSISVRSTPGAGSCFTIRLPLLS